MRTDYTHPRKGTETEEVQKMITKDEIILIPARGRKLGRAVLSDDVDLIILIPARGRKLRQAVQKKRRKADYTHPRKGTETSFQPARSADTA